MLDEPELLDEAELLEDSELLDEEVGATTRTAPPPEPASRTSKKAWLAVVVGLVASAAGVAAALWFLQSEQPGPIAVAARVDESMASIDGPNATSAATPPAPTQLAAPKKPQSAAHNKPTASKAKAKAKAPRASAKRAKPPAPRSTAKKAPKAPAKK
jgi:hypothetical protein